MKNGIEFRRRIIGSDATTRVTLPSEVINFLDVKLGDRVVISAESGKHGKFIAIWKEEVTGDDEQQSS